MYRSKQKQAFTLIELLMVIAIIGILAGILIPTVGAVRKQANIAASKSQLSNYVTAITMFKGEYGYFPFTDAQVTGDSKGGKNVNSLNDDFIQTLSGRDGSTVVQEGGNRRSIGFHSFSESEFLLDDNDQVATPLTIADRFSNTNIFIVIDGDGDNKLKTGLGDEVRTSVTAWVVAVPDSADDPAAGAPNYKLYE